MHRITRTPRITRLARTLTLATGVALATTLALSACSSSASAGGGASTTTAADGSCAGALVVVDFGVLGQSPISKCVSVPAGTTKSAKAIATEAGLALEGTAKYGDAVLCRLNGLPAADEPFTAPGHAPYTETCADMPPAYGYWGIWLRNGLTSPWEMAEASIADEPLSAGTALGLIFTTGPETPSPVATSAK
jgi:hypothetical protein